MRANRYAALLALTMAALAGCSSSSSGSSSGGRHVAPEASTSASTTSGVTAASEALALDGGVIRPPDVEPSITLTDTAGASYNLKARNHGKVTLIYFGYTHCPDVCPTTMADIAEALRQSTATVRSKVTVVFVTTDPRRDTLSVMRRWLDAFNPSFVGLRGTPEQITKVELAAGVPASRVSRNGKSVEHSAEILAYTPDGKAHVIYSENPATIGDLTHDLPILTLDQGFA